MIWRFAIFAALLVLTVEAKKYTEASAAQRDEWQQFEEFLKWKKFRELRENYSQDAKYEKEHRESHDVDRIYERNQEVPISNPPPINEVALMARYIVNQADWVPVATISTRKDIEMFPAVTLVSFTDGLLGNGSGIPYLYLTPLDFTAQDLAKDNRVSMLMTLAQGDYCKSKQLDPMDPRCARVLLTGRIKALKNDSVELRTAEKVFFTRHPKLVNMPPSHHFYFAKLKIMTIVVLDTFGGPKYVSVKEYLNPPVVNVTEEFNRRFPLEAYQSDSREEYQPLSNNVLTPMVRAV